MTVASTTNRSDLTITSGTTDYPYAFRIFADGDLVVVRRNPTTGEETPMVLNTDYSVTGAGNYEGGNVVLSLSYATTYNGYGMTIRRVLATTQNTSIRNQGAFYPEVHEDVFDRLAMVDQQQQEEIDRSVKLPETIAPSEFDPTLPAGVTAGAGRTLLVNATGDGFEMGPTATEIGNAQAASTAALAALDSFDDRYLGAKASDPTLDNDGNALLTGALYWNTTSNAMRVYSGSNWTEFSSVAYVPATYSGDGVTTSFTLPVAPVSKNNVFASISGVNQNKSMFSVSETTLTFVSAPPAGTDNIEFIVAQPLPVASAASANVQHDGTTLDLILKNSVGKVVNSIAALKSIDKTKYTQAFVVDYYGDGKGGGGLYYLYSSTGGLAAHNGGGDIGANDDGWWKLVVTNRLDVRQFGAKPDDSTDSFSAIQAAINYAISNKMGEVYAPGKYKITDTLVMDTASYTQGVFLVGDGNTSRIRQTGAGKDAIWFSTTQFLRNSGIKDIEIYCEATAGHGVNIKFGCTVCRFENVNITVLNTSKSIYFGSWIGFSLGAPCGVFDTIWDGGDYYITNSHTTHGFDFITKGTTFNENTFRNLRASQSGTVQFFRVVNTDNNSYLVNNKFSNINFEICKGGGILAYNARGWMLENLSFWDTPTGYNNHLVHFASNSGLVGASNTFINIIRNGDSLNGGAKDIFTEYTDDTTVINCYTPAGSYDWNNRRVTVIGLKMPTEANSAGRIYLNQDTSITAYACLTGAGASLKADGLASISRVAAGQYRLTFLAAKGATTYRVCASIAQGTVGWIQWTKTTGYVDIFCTNSAGAAFDPTLIDVTIFG